MPKNYCIMQIWAESGKSALPICNYSQILYQFLTFTQNLKRSLCIIIRYLLKPFIYAKLQMNNYYGEIITEYLTNYMCFMGYRTKRVDGLIPFNKRSVIIM